jgi:hypothetical protein
LLVLSYMRPLASIITLAVLLSPATARAQARTATPDLSTIWAEVTVGGAGARLTCDVCQSARDVGPAITLALGAYASPQLRVGLEAGRWTYEENAVREHVHTFGLVAHLVPNLRRGLFFLGGLGWSGYRAGEFKYDAPRLTVGAGWDLPIYGRWVVGNVVAIDAASFAALKTGSTTVARNVGLSSARVSVQVRRR